MWSGARRPRAEFLGAIEAEADRLTRLVTNLLDLSRIEAGALRLELDWNDLEELLREAAYRAERTEAATAPRQVRVEIERPLPFLRFDYVLIDRVVANLLENALHYSPPGSPVCIGVAAEPGQVRVTVRDQGPGIPVEERERVFAPFYRGAGRGAAGGSGLGLAICRGIVAAHGGQIAVEESVRGAAVSFSLPRAPLGDPFSVFDEGSPESAERSATVTPGRFAPISDGDVRPGSREESVDRTAGSEAGMPDRTAPELDGMPANGPAPPPAAGGEGHP